MFRAINSLRGLFGVVFIHNATAHCRFYLYLF